VGAVAAVAGVALGLVTPATVSAAEADVTPPAAFDIVPDAGEFQSGWNVASPYSSVYVTWEVTTDETSTVTYEIGVDGVVSRLVDEVGYTTLTKRVEVPEGTHTVSVTAVDSAGNRRPATNTLDVVVDKESPVFTSHPLLLLRTGPITDAGYPMRFTWSGSDEGTGLALGRIGPDESCCYTFDPTLNQYDFAVPAQSSVAWRIWLYDGVGRLTRTGRDGYVAPVPWSDTRRSVGWERAADAQALDGSEWISDDRGDRFRTAVQGRSVAWVTSTGPRRGVAEVLLDGRVVASVDLYSAERRPARVVWTRKISGADTTVVTVVNRSRGQRDTIGVDAFLLQR
jgi:hypothetical protein